MRLEKRILIVEKGFVERVISKMSRMGYRVGFALVWFVNGLFCKVLDGVPRHRAIVARILGAEHARALTCAIGVGEILFGVWILSGIRWRTSALAQIVLVGAMNLLEFVLAPDLLLFGRLNSIVALAYICIVSWAGFRPDTSKAPQIR